MTNLDHRRPSLTSRAWAQPRSVPRQATATQRAAHRITICRTDLAAASAILRMLTNGTTAHTRQQALVDTKAGRLKQAKIAYQTARLLELRSRQ